MKNILYITLFLSAVLAGCNSLDDTYDELDKTAGDPSGVQVFELTLSEDDYALLEDDGVGSNNNFSSEDEAKEYIAKILDLKYPQLEDGSSISVTYNLYRGGSVDSYTVSEADYEAETKNTEYAAYFNQDTLAENHIATILNSAKGSDNDGQVVIVKYDSASTKYADINGEVLFVENFNNSSFFETTDTTSLVGAEAWDASSYGTDAYAKMSGNSGKNYVNEDWLVLPKATLTSNFGNYSLVVRHAVNYLNGGAAFGKDIMVKVSTNFSGNVETATWSDLTPDTWPEGNSYSFVDSKFELADYAGATVNIAFVYKSTADYAPVWEVDNAMISAGTPVLPSTEFAYYMYSAEDESWVSAADDVLELSKDTYSSMGLKGYFTSSTPQESYVPQYLASAYPYAQEEDEVTVIYNYFSSSKGELEQRGVVYTFMSGVWNAYESEVATTLQFGKEEGVWVPDNTIRYTLSPADYTAIASNEDLGTEASRANLDSYGNFNTNAGNWTTETIEASIAYILKTNFPNSEVGQKYLVSYDSYPGGLLSLHVILNSDGEYETID